MVLFGGACDHLMSFERGKQELRWDQHMWGLIRSWTLSVFIAGLVYTGGQASQGWPPPICWFLTGGLCAFATDSIRWVNRMIRALGEKIFGVKPPKDDDGPPV